MKILFATKSPIRQLTDKKGPKAFCGCILVPQVRDGVLVTWWHFFYFGLLRNHSIREMRHYILLST